MFTGDPFGDMFGDMHRHMRQQMQGMDQMMQGMMDPFGMLNRHSMFAGMIDDGSRHQRPPSHRDDMALMNPFGGGLFGGIMRQMEDMQGRAANDPNSQVFSHSTMISYDGRNGGQPRVVEKSFRKTGDVKETRHAVRTGEDGIGDKLMIEHTIGDRTHVIEKKRDRGGQIRQKQRFVNLDEQQAKDFDREFSQRARHQMGSGSYYSSPAIESRSGSANGGGNRRTYQRIGNRVENAPIITLPDEDDDDVGAEHLSSTKRTNADGPIIREVADDSTEDGNKHKRRKGTFGRLFKANDD